VLRSDDPNVIDGFSSVQAVKRTGRTTGARFRESRSRLPITDAPPGKTVPPGAKPGSRIGRTIVPERHEIVCYACGFAFFLTGRIDKTFCPKCRECLTFEELTVDARWSGNLRTIGVITIARGGTVTGGTVVATDIVLEGAVTGGTVTASRRLELGPGAACDLTHLAWQDIRIRPGAEIALPGELHCRDIRIEGTLRARVAAAGRIVIAAGGVLRGAARGAHLDVHAGAGLSARLRIAPDAAPPPPEQPRVPAVPGPTGGTAAGTPAARRTAARKDTADGKRAARARPAAKKKAACKTGASAQDSSSRTRGKPARKDPKEIPD
jgi:cytoskeletal protein CcmA (bactofilin family)